MKRRTKTVAALVVVMVMVVLMTSSISSRIYGDDIIHSEDTQTPLGKIILETAPAELVPIEEADFGETEMNDIIAQLDPEILNGVSQELGVATPAEYLRTYYQKDPSIEKILNEQYEVTLHN